MGASVRSTLRGVEAVDQRELFHQASEADASFELRHLRYFVAVTQRLHFGRAAKALHISQPPLSRQIRDLRAYVGVPPFDRSAKSVVLTQLGAAFLQQSRGILNHVLRSVHIARRTAAGEIGHLSLAFAPFLDSDLLYRLRQAFAQEHPDVPLLMHRVKSEDQGALISAGIVDAGLMMLPVANPHDLLIEPLRRQSAVALLSQLHPLAGKNAVTLRELSQYSMAAVHTHPGIEALDHSSRIATMCGATLRPEKCFASFEMLLKAVADSCDIAFLPESSEHQISARFCRIPVVDRGADFTFALAYRRTGIRTLSPASFILPADSMKYQERNKSHV